MDLDSLITTIVTSTAALIAIIGGFLVSRVISLSSEQNVIRRRIKEIDVELDIKKKQKIEVHQIIVEDDVDRFIIDNIEDLVIDEKELTDIIENDSDNELTFQELFPYIEEFYLINKELEDKISDASEIPDDFDEFLSINDYKIDHTDKKEWYERAYDVHYSELEKQLPKSGFPYAIHLPPIPRLPAHNFNRDWYRGKIKEHEELANEISLLEKHRIDQKNILQDYGQPHGVLGGMIVLAYASIVGIVIPSMFLPYNNALINYEWDKWLLLSLFFSQLAALFIYLGNQVRKLSNLDNRKSTSD